MENDLVVIRGLELGYQPKEFNGFRFSKKKPGDYALRTNKYSFYDLNQRF